MISTFPRRAVAVLAVAATLASLGGASGLGPVLASAAGPAPSSADAATLTIGARVDNNSFDPADLEIGNRVQYWQPVYDTLLRLDADGEPQPNLATEWSYNEDSSVLTLQLRDDVTFTDGAMFDGEAVKANIEHIAAGTGQNQFMVAAIEEVVVNSPTEVELRLSEPSPSLLSYLALVGGVMASPAALESDSIASEPVGSGPYIYDAAASTPGSSYRYTRNEDYWNPDDYPFDAYEVRPINGITPTLNALKTGQIDGALLTPAVAAEAESSGITINTLSVAWAGLILADREGTMVPELADVRVRQAINYAIDREGIVEFILSGYGAPSSQLFVQNEASVEEIDDTYTYDVERAQSLIEEAGVGEFTITMPQWDSPWNDLFPVLADELAQIGITVEYEQIPPDQAISSVLSGDYPVAFFPLASASAWQDMQTWITPSAPWNMIGAQDPELDELLANVLATTGDDQATAFQEVNRWLVENAWFAPFFHQDQIFGTTGGVTTEMQAQNAVPSLWQFRPAG